MCSISAIFVSFQELARQITMTEILICRAQSLRTKFSEEKDRKSSLPGTNIKPCLHVKLYIQNRYYCGGSLSNLAKEVKYVNWAWQQFNVDNETLQWSQNNSHKKKNAGYANKPGVTLSGLHCTLPMVPTHGLENLENGKTFSSQRILNRLEKWAKFTQNTGKVFIFSLNFSWIVFVK